MARDEVGDRHALCEARQTEAPVADGQGTANPRQSSRRSAGLRLARARECVVVAVHGLEERVDPDAVAGGST